MFSDHWYADMVRYQSKTWFNLGRNTESVITPAAGLSFIFFGVGMLLYPVDADESAMGWLLGGGAAFFLFAAVLGLIPFRLPGPMYPEWQMEKRRARAEAAARDAGMDDELTQSTGRHAAEPRKPAPGAPAATRSDEGRSGLRLKGEACDLLTGSSHGSAGGRHRVPTGQLH